jgi:hypothetical protein
MTIKPSFGPESKVTTLQALVRLDEFQGHAVAFANGVVFGVGFIGTYRLREAGRLLDRPAFWTEAGAACIATP